MFLIFFYFKNMEKPEIGIGDAIPLIVFSMGYIALVIWLSICFHKNISSANIEYIFTLSLIPLILIIAAMWGYKIKLKFPRGEIYFSPVETVMEPPHIIHEEKTGKDAEKLMEEKGTDFLNVVDGEGKFKGIFTKGDAYEARRKRRIGNKLKNIMMPKEKVVSSFKGERIIDAIHKIGESKHSRLPVLDGEKVIGVIDSVIIHKFLSKLLRTKR